MSKEQRSLETKQAEEKAEMTREIYQVVLLTCHSILI